MFPSSPQLTETMRNILVEWLMEVHDKMGLRYETLYLTILLADMYCAKKNVSKAEYQLLGMACLFLAGKYEEVATPKLRKIIALCDRLYESSDILRMESEILLEFNFKISQPSINWFIGVETFAIRCNNQSNHHSISLSGMEKFIRVCYYVTELCLFEI